MVVADGSTPGQRRKLQQELHWEGFGTFAPGVYARPAQPPSTVARIVDALDLADDIVIARAFDDESLGGQRLSSAVARAWNFTGVADDYRRFLARFGSVIQRFRRDDDGHDPAQSFIVRTLLIHEYRRVLLRDPQLPAALLPLDWRGSAAYALCRDFYRLTHRAAERHLLSMLRNERGKLPPASPDFHRRFGGLKG
jgi:phenylacetic acid degradation operon negative regulatory protein